MTHAPLLMGFVGDLLVDRDTFDDPFVDVRDLLAVPDIMFGNIEGPYTDAPHHAPSATAPVHGAARHVRVFGPAGFNVVNLANNHILDAGYDALLETRDALAGQGIATCGAGADIASARAPAILDRNGLKTAFLGYASVFPIGFEARPGVPGLAPLRAYNFWRSINEHAHAPGYLPIEQTIPDQADMDALAADIAAARAAADIVVTSFHWGDHMRAFHLSDHERRTARFCIDQGADVVVGHHHHALRGMEWVEGRPVMYGLGHFVFDLRFKMSDEQMAAWAASAAHKSADSYEIFPREGWPLLPMHPDTRLTLVAWVEMAGREAVGMGFVPCRLRPDGRVQPVAPDGEEGREVVAYLERCQLSQGLNGRIVPGDRMLGRYRTMKIVPL